MTKDMEFHPLADVFPLIEGVEFAELVSSVLARGQLEKIITYEGKILDGRNRYLACKQAGVTPVSEEFEGTFDEARDHVIDANLRRRHLDTSQRAIIASKLANITHGGDRRSAQAANLPDVSQAKAAEMLNVSERSVRDARKVLEHGAPEVIQAVESGKLAVSRAAAIASLPREAQAARLSEPMYDLASPPDLPRPARSSVSLRPSPARSETSNISPPASWPVGSRSRRRMTAHT